MHDVIVVGGGFAGVTAAREARCAAARCSLLEARERLGGRTWSADWDGRAVEYGGAWVHWHQPHTWSEITRAGLRVELSDDAERAAGTSAASGERARSRERDAIAERGWNRFVDGVARRAAEPARPAARLDASSRASTA